MNKMDEIMELLTEEIEGFNRSIKKLEKLSRKWDDLRIKADSSHIEDYIKDFLQQQKIGIDTYKEGAKETSRIIKSATLIPRWLITLCCVATCIIMFTFGYFGYHFIRFEENKQEAFRQGRVEAISELGGYFDDHPIIYRDFQRWSKKKDSPSNQE
ncbi:DUF6730 family protein [Flagellimonas sp. CMM7]|uniref:DUF6730 family protein n=1 Tax=Flagellimonas sp. CMM7 TaxID=2654676 RepID=UPI0013D3E6CA|nr:DUF6730 family protein [Flagellimonas sp. CMM7]UII79332.1 hypothetical protein LV704_16930 [Flagellimonas sp. CMM7]